MTEFIVGVGSALWLGVLTSISPCPLATNIAAISYIGRKVGNARHVFLTGLLYTLGRTLAYVALAFVLVSAALFFGSLVPLSLQLSSRVTLPALYGIGTALPVLVFAVLLATSAQSVGRAYNALAKIEWWARMLTGGIFILVGIYFSLAFVFGVI